ncbi:MULTISPECIES: TauD/TfdA family dioxygenase [unclassified Ruegeria]|uniref:TauD/TfdA dioxygenase family protein n=1 Tax=unclassified Ruegeria TaxID=2625375 RepID=UPI001487F11D|nr:MULTISPECIES: TauD/TfdA family dioxygenase [unclassified Ruegeria]NOD49129.1 TauD/TfdA family dioxygenase [Ruegeria sp. HKCCD5849]NOD51693.1 TauD/TfdA family dioxygenase [Ruegeria sp. HKCCD5851]NOD68679.1 TauD/TfdA family dioxygenase [Ruegeria sp. HKCCD7303]NOE34955.1 TauD/TfdA family dioxygenase [Ruegeria sp. HKCCD7318]
MRTSPLHPRFGLVVHDLDLRDVTKQRYFPEIRRAFETRSVLLFPAQSISDADHIRLAELFGPLENREAMAAGRDVEFQLPELTNKTKDGLRAKDDLRLLDLQANMLWHTDSTFLPTPALINILTAKVVPPSGGETEIASTRAAWAHMPDRLKSVLRDAIIWHRLSHSRSKISADLAALPKMTRWPDRPWRAIWPNPVTGEEALFIASHAFAIEGMGHEQSQSLLDEAIAFCTQPEYVYSHHWSVGDVLIWDERATMHRGRPWDYDHPRTLKSICCSVTETDGLHDVRVV